MAALPADDVAPRPRGRSLLVSIIVLLVAGAGLFWYWLPVASAPRSLPLIVLLALLAGAVMIIKGAFHWGVRSLLAAVLAALVLWTAVTASFVFYRGIDGCTLALDTMERVRLERTYLPWSDELRCSNQLGPERATLRGWDLLHGRS